MDNTIKLEIEGLSALQVEELKSALTKEGQETSLIQTVTPTLKGGLHGEPGMVVALIQLATVAIPIVAQWLAKQRRKRRGKLVVRTKMPDGTVREVDFSALEYEEGANSESQLESVLKAALDGKAEGTVT